jgi:alpha-glucosidase
MQLLPYLYTLFRESEQTGAPVWRPLFYEFPDDPHCALIDDQLMLGSALLLAPVMRRAARSRKLYLPPGTWIGWSNGARYEGGREWVVDAPLEQMPIFVRGGSVIPCQSSVLNSEAVPREPLRLEVFPGSDGSGVLYEDDGASHDYRPGDQGGRAAYALTEMRLRDRAGGRLRLEIGRREGRYEIASRWLRIVMHACPRPTAVYADGVQLPLGTQAPSYRWRAGRIEIVLRDEGRGRSVEVEPAP